MEGCVTRAVHDLITACARDDSAKLNEAVSMVTVATESLTTEKGPEKTFEVLKSMIKSELSVMSLNGDHAHTTHPHTFWAIVNNILTSSTLHTLHTLHTNLLSSLSHHSLPSLRPGDLVHLHKAIFSNVAQKLPPDNNSFSTFEDLVLAMARVQLLAECASYLTTPPHEFNELKKQAKIIIIKGPKIVHERYKQYILLEVGGDCHVTLTDGGGVLKSVDLLTGSLLLMATVTKAMDADDTIVIETILRLFNNCLEHLVQLTKQFPRELSLSTLYSVFNSLLHLQVCYQHLITLLDFKEHSYTEQLSVNLRECRGYLRERVVCYHQQLCVTSLLHDSEANNWTGKQPFYDNERCSFPIQMWRYHILSLQHDLCTLVPALAEGIVMEILSHTLSFIAGRYQLITPSHKRVLVARVDIVCTLLTVWELLGDHTHSHSVHQSCDSLLLSLAVTLTPLTSLTAHLTTPMQTLEKNQIDWKLFLSVNLPSSSTSCSKSGISLDVDLQEGTSKRSHLLFPYHQTTGSSWPSLLQVLCEDTNLAVKVCGCEGVGSHLMTVLSHCYHMPHSLSRLYIQCCQLAETGQNVNKARQTLMQTIKDPLLTCTLLGATRVHSSTGPINKGGVLEEVVHELVEEVSTLPSPVLLLIRTMADTEASSHQSLGGRVAKVLADVLGEWLNSLVSRLSQPLTSVLAEYTTLLTSYLSGSSWQQFESFKQFEEIFSTLEVASSQVGVASFTEYNMAIEVMKRDHSLLKSLKLVYDRLTPSHHTHNTLTTHNTIGDVPMSTIMEQVDQLKWDDLLAMVCPSRAQVGQLVARRWEFQESNSSLLTEEESKQVYTIKNLVII